MSFFTLTLLIRLITATLGTLAFAIIFRVDRRHLFPVSVAGLFTYFIFYTVSYFGGSIFLAALASTGFTALFGEIAARVFHAPVLLYLLTGCIPIVPGGDVYYSMKYLLEGNTELAGQKLLQTAEASLGIAGGIVLVSVLFGLFTDAVASLKRKKEKKDLG